MWTKEKIQELLSVSNKAVIRAVFAIQARQTADEQAGGTTKHENGVGWSRNDAEWMAQMIQAYQRWGSLTPRQMAITRNKVKRYHRQLIEIANANAAIREQSIQPAVPADDDPEAQENLMVMREISDYEAAQERARREAKEQWEARAGMFA